MRTWRKSLQPDERIGALAWMIALTWVTSAAWVLTLLAAAGVGATLLVRRGLR